MSTFKYPPQAANGKLLLSENYTKEAIIQAVQTRYGERVFRNRYGNDIDEFSIVRDLSSLLLDLEEAIINSTQEYRPISFSLTGDISTEGVVSVHIEYDNEERTQNITVTL